MPPICLPPTSGVRSWSGGAYMVRTLSYCMHINTRVSSYSAIEGDIVYVNVFCKSLVILNSAKQATSMLDMKSSIYSDRLNTQMGGELVGWNKSLPGLPYGRQSREQRRYIHQSVGSKVLMGKHHEAIVDENRKFLKRVLGGDEDIGLEIHRQVFVLHSIILYLCLTTNCRH